MPQPVHRRCPLLLISRADFKIRLLFHSKRLFDWFPADVCTAFGPQPTAGLIKWGEGRLQVKAAMRHPLSEVWWDPGPVCQLCWRPAACILLWEVLGGKALGLCKPAGYTEESGTWVWSPYALRHAGGGESCLKVSQGAGSANALCSATAACSMYLNLQIQDFVQEIPNLPCPRWEHGWGAVWVIWCFGRSLTVCVWIVLTE